VQNASLAVTGTFFQATQPVSGSGNFTVVQPTGTNLHIVCDSGCSSSAGFADNSAFTFGTTAINPIGGVLDDTATNTATENSAAVARITPQKAIHANLRNQAGTEMGTSGAPLRTDPTGATTQPMSAASLPLPTGAATSANQDGIIRDGTGDTTQANVSTGRLHVDGSGVTQPVSGTVTANIGTFPDNEPFNVAQMNGVAVTMGNGVAGTGVQRVTIASDSTGQINAVGTLADDGAAAATNRVGTLPAIAQSSYNPSSAGRNTALNTGALSGNLFSSNLPEPSIASYSAAAVVAPAASATDIAVLSGNATNTVLVTELSWSCTQTTAGIVQLHIIKRSTADTAGTSVAQTEVPDDANYAAASSAVLTYTANPTTGTPVGDIDVAKVGCLAPGTASPNDIYIANLRQKPIVLRGTAQQLVFNLNGATLSGGSVALKYKWIETTGP
jgi:hypothetical protein